MSGFKLRDIYLGVNDGKKEALYKNDFENYFVEYNNNYNDILKPEKYLIIGRKGSGKTILAEYVKKQAVKKNSWYCKIKSYKDFRFQELINFKTNDVSPNEYSAIWRWIILLDIAKLIFEDHTLNDKQGIKKLQDFFKENYNSLDIDDKKILEINKNNKINGSILTEIINISGEKGSEIKFGDGNYLNYIEDLERVILKILKSSKSKYTLFYDELDDRFQNDEFYRNSLISLIKAVDSLNCGFLEEKIDFKVVLLIRSDIFAVLNDTDLNKLKVINTLNITWGEKVSSDSPLLHLVVKKAKKSNLYLNSLSDIRVLKTLFPQDVKKIAPERFILERTFFRPRDIITLLNLIIHKYPESRYFGWKGLHEIKSSYSEYLFDEVRNEMIGHISQEEIDQGLKLLKNYNQHFFEYSDLRTYYEANKTLYSKIDLDKILIEFFKFNVIGNKWFNRFKQKEYYTWAHRDSRAEIDLNKEIVIHLGLREHLSM
ncbi:hypothetical protein SAMN05421841_0202 [Chryseobacterium wanjuense]|uniref:KAP family P-loop domain-containing protein n=1 Tax=Chryseobacterium wanjuense TaxID=356305 RepID=A0A1I0MTR5_9FLAO|nr:hypothetical protein [Chryseobacterium wanjuense]SEV92138.1 hypothetical protein SAMN05421841_0202 [Chryseobacterium wanjuense]